MKELPAATQLKMRGKIETRSNKHGVAAAAAAAVEEIQPGVRKQGDTVEVAEELLDSRGLGQLFHFIFILFFLCGALQHGRLTLLRLSVLWV